MRRLNSKESVFLLNWFLAAIIGMVAGWQFFDMAIFRTKWDYFSVSLNWVTSMGFFISLTQWLVIQQVSKTKWWLIASFVGYIVSGIIAGTIDEALHQATISTDNYREIFAFVTGVSVGIVVGSIQWLSLRHLFSKASLWIITTTLGWGFGLLMFRIDFPSFIFATPSLELVARFAWLIHIVIFCVPMSGITGLAILKASSHVKEQV